MSNLSTSTSDEERRQKRLAQKRASYQRNRKKILEHKRQCQLSNRSAIAQKRYEFYRRLKQEVLAHYGVEGKAVCCHCPENRIHGLTIDHINGGGNQHRKETKKKGSDFYNWLKLNGFPEGYRTLCMNCNRKAHFTLEKPKLSTSAKNVRSRRKTAKLKRLFFEKLGLECVKCGNNDFEVLTVGHMNNDGGKHRQQLKVSGGSEFYRVILKLNDFSGLETQCFSCNLIEACLTSHHAF